MKLPLLLIISFLAHTVFAQVTGSSTNVAITSGDLSVSLIGSATYNMPIAVPPGINNVQPSISLTYNSAAGNGIAGYGWNISGISAITRIPSTKYHDNNADPVDLDNLDRFALDGQRLIVKNGTNGVYGANGTVYETEVFSNIKITSFGVNSTGNGPLYFLVQYPDGSKAQYGNTVESRTLTTWGINFISNAQDIKINYNYLVQDNNLCIISIGYGEPTNAGLTSGNSIVFTYKQRQRNEQFYVAGQNVKNDKILSSIATYSYNVGYREYQFEHFKTYLGYEKITKIIEKSQLNQELNPTVFEYNENATATKFDTADGYQIDKKIDNATHKSVTGDFDGDGKTDYLFFEKNTKVFGIYKNLQPSSTNIALTKSIAPVIEGYNFAIWTPANIIDVFINKTLDTATSGATVLKSVDNWTVVAKYNRITYYITYALENNTITFKDIKKLDAGPDNPVVIYDPITAMPTQQFFPYYNEETLNGDFNNDGQTDCIIIHSQKNSLGMDDSTWGLKINEQRAYFKDLNKTVNTNFTSTLLLPYSNEPDSNGWTIPTSKTKDNQVLDFDGDGKLDFMAFDSKGIRIFTLNVSNNTIYELCNYPVLDMADKKHFIGDFNGDGKSDIVVPTDFNQDSWTFFISTGTTFYKSTKPIGVNYNVFQEGVYDTEYSCQYICVPSIISKIRYSVVTTNYIINDFDGDGKTDIMRQQEKRLDSEQINQNSSLNVNGPFVQDISNRGGILYNNAVIYNNSSVNNLGIPAFIGSSEIFSNYSYNNFNIGGYTIVSPFKDSNKLFSLGYTTFNGKYISVNKFNKNHKNEMLLKTITNGNGVKDKITYKALIEDGADAVYKACNSNFESYPNFDIRNSSDLLVVSMIEKQSTSVNNKKLFSYSQAVANVEGLGFLGFKKVAYTDWFANGEQMLTNVQTNSILNRGSILILEKVSDLLPVNINQDYQNSIINKQIFDYNATPLQNNKVFKLSLSGIYEENKLHNYKTFTANTYNNFNNLLSKQVRYGIANSIIYKTILNSFTYDNQPNSSTYIIGRPLSKSENITAGSEITSSEELYTYTNNLPTQIKKKGHNTSYITEDNVFDSLGNIKRKTISAVGETPRVTNFEYSIQAGYGGRFLTKKIDSDGLATSYTYFTTTGDLWTELQPSILGSPLLTTYNYDLWGKKVSIQDYLGKIQLVDYTRQNEKTLVRISGEDGTQSIKLYDDLGRTIETSEKTLDGNFSKIAYEYDNHNRVIRVSEPYFGSPLLWSQSQYDLFGRVISTSEATGKITNFAYNFLTITTNDGTLEKIITKDTSGNIRLVTDNPGGTISYEYFANDNLKKTTTSGVSTTITQDGWGQKISLNDPSAGLYTYQYNGFGEVKKEITPNGFTDYTYSPTGQILSKWVKDAATPLHTNIKSDYVYNTSSKLLESIAVTNPFDGNSNYLYTYDNYKRIINTKEEFTTSDARTFQKAVAYDGFGKPYQEITTATIFGKNSTKTILYSYTNGQISDIVDPTNGDKQVWSAKSQNERGQNTSEIFGKYIEKTTFFDEYGHPIKTAFRKENPFSPNPIILLGLTNEFDNSRNNLIVRSNSMFNWNEKFEYDNSDRLTTINNQLGDFTQNYHDNGTIQDNSLGEYNYTNTAKPYRNTSINITDEALGYYNNTTDQQINYTSFKSPLKIQMLGKEILSFSYNANEQRTAMYYGNEDANKLLRPYRKYYSADGSIEIKYTLATPTVPEKIEFFTYLGGDAYTAPAVCKQINNNPPENYYLFRDYLGSILAIVNSKDEVIEKRLFDAWGGILKVEDINSLPLPALTFFDRGYTGHEHLESAGLINMNGRLYDPKLHRFLQPDNNLQDPFNTQNYNRYGYVLNNPLKYNDPSGESWGSFFAYLGALVFTTYAAGATSSGELNPLKWDSATWTNAALSGLSNVISNVATNASNKYIEGYGKNRDFITMESPFDESLTKFGTGRRPEYSNKYAWDFSDTNPELNRLSKNTNFLYADGSAPDGYKSVDGQLYNKKGIKINGVTLYNKRSKSHDVYLSKSAFVSRPQLYMTMHHEYMHASLQVTNKNFREPEQHRIIHQWQNDQFKAWGPMDSSLFNDTRKYTNPRNTSGNYPMHYSQFGFNIINYRP